MSELTGLAKRALIVMVLDLEYDAELPATYGHVPMRHNGLWHDIIKALGKEVFDAEVRKLMVARRDGNMPLKTNPQISDYARRLYDDMSQMEGRIPTLKWYEKTFQEALEKIAGMPNKEAAAIAITTLKHCHKWEKQGRD